MLGLKTNKSCGAYFTSESLIAKTGSAGCCCACGFQELYAYRAEMSYAYLPTSCRLSSVGVFCSRDELRVAQVISSTDGRVMDTLQLKKSSSSQQ
jgi:hypothetical protein